MKRLCLMVAAMAVSFGVYADLTVVSSLDGSNVTYAVSGAAAAATARPVYLAWGETDAGADWAKWEEAEKVGTLAANATSMTFTLPARVKTTCPMRVFLFSGTDGDNVWLDAIRADNDQYLNTGIKPNPQTACFIDVKMADNVVQQRLFGIDGGLCFQTYINGSKQWAYTFKDGEGNWQGLSIDVTATDRVQYLVDGYRNYLRLQYNGVDKKKVFGLSSTRTVEGTSPVGVLTHLSSNGTKRYSNTANTHNSYTWADLYGFYMKKSGALVSCLKPCKKDGVACAYDGIQRKHLMSGTANAFVAVDPIGEIVDSGTELVFAGTGTDPLEAEEVSGNASVRLGGGIVKMNTANTYTGPTTLACGMLWMDEILSDALGALGAKAPLMLGPGTLSWNGGTGVYNGDVTTKLDFMANNKEGFSPAVVFDVAEGGDLTLAGKFDNPNGAFVKTGKGTLRIPGGAGTNITLAATGGYVDALCLQALKFNANGDTPTKGYSGFCLAGGTLVLGEKGGTFEINGSASDTMIGTMTKDPVLDAGEQEDGNGVLEVRGGEVNINNWLGMGAKCGFTTTTPNYVPESGIRVYGGTLRAKASFGMGRNKNAVPQKDADGNYIPMRTKTFIEVHGGEFQIWDTSRFSPCDDAGADSRILVDGGRLFLRGSVQDGTPTTSAGFRVGNCSDGANETPSHADLTIRDTGVLESTDNYICNARKNVTVEFKVLDGGTARWNRLYKNSSKDGARFDVLFDGGVAEQRYAGYPDWVKADLDSFRVGTRGMTFTIGDATGDRNVRNTINKTLTATNTHPDEVAQGVTVLGGKGDRFAGFRFAVPQAWDGPTTIGRFGICELTGTGAFPSLSPVTIEPTGKLVATNQPQTFASLAIGRTGTTGLATLGLAADQLPLTANAFSRDAQAALAVELYSTAGDVAPLSTAGTYTLVRVPVAAKATLEGLAVSCANPAADTGYAFAVNENGDFAELRVTVGAETLPALQTTEGNELIVTDPITGSATLTPNASATGGGLVDLSGALGSFAGRLVGGSGTVKFTDAGFAANRPDALVLGPGTLWFAGAAAEAAGLIIDAGSAHAGVLRIDDSLTLWGLSNVTGAMMKKGTGDLIFKGNGLFDCGNQDNSFSRSAKDSVKENGDGPTASLKSLLVSEGRLVIGTKDDPEDAPQVVLGTNLGVGCRSRGKETEDTRPETAGELILNNGSVTMPDYCYLGFYNGTPATDPTGALQSKIIVNGGVFSAKAMRLYHDNNGNMMTGSPTLEVNGGEVNLSTYLESAYSSYTATDAIAPVSTVRVMGGILRVGKDFNIGCSAASPESVTIVGGTGILEVTGNINLSQKATSKPQRLYLNEGGTIRTKGSIVHGAGTSEIYFRGGVWEIGYGHGSCVGPAIANHTAAYVGEAGVKIDCRAWADLPLDSSYIEMKQKFLRDPELGSDEADGGIELRGPATAVFRSAMNGSTITGPIVSKDGFVIGVDNGCQLFKTHEFRLGAGGGFRASGDGMYINSLTLGEEDGTEPIVLDWCNNAYAKQLVCSNAVSVLSPVTVAFHRGGGSCGITGIRAGSFDVLYYRAADDANVPLDQFVANPKFPDYTFAYAKSDITSGAYAGWKKVSVVITANPGAATDTWKSTSAGGLWEDVSNWVGETRAANATNALAVFQQATAAAVPVSVTETPTVGKLTLQATSAANGYKLTGAPLNLNHSDFLTPPSVIAKSGTHELAGGLVTDDAYSRSNETAANGGCTGAIGVAPETDAKVVLSGPVTTDPKRELYVNNPALKDGGTTVIAAPVSTKEVVVQSGTLELDDFANLGDAALTVKAATLHYTGAATETATAFTGAAGSNLVATVLNLDSDVTFTGPFTSTSGALVKSGPGALRLTYPGSVKLGFGGKSGQSGIVGWNSTTAWPANGDSLVSNLSPFYLDDGSLTVGRVGQTCAFGASGNNDIFLGSQPRAGWTYDASNKVTFNFLAGTLNGAVIGLQHGMRRGTNPSTLAGGKDRCWFEYNQYGGTASFGNIYFGYELTQYDNHCLASMNLHGGTFKANGYFRLGQTHCKDAGENEPHATVNVYDGATLYLSNANWPSRIVYMSYAAGSGDLKNHQNKSEDATLNMFGGSFTNASHFYVGSNGSEATINLKGGVLGCVNLMRLGYTKGQTDNSTNRVYAALGRAYLNWDGGEFRPTAAMESGDHLKSDELNATLANFTAVRIGEGGARISTAELKNPAKTYTIAQALESSTAADGGLVKLGANTLALTGANAYNGPTVVAAGTLLIPANADPSAIPSNSVVSVAEGATLEFADGAKAAVKGLTIDCASAGGTIKGFRPAKRGNLYLTNASGVSMDTVLANLAIDGFTGATRLRNWNVYVNGLLNTGYGLTVANGRLVICPHGIGMSVIIK